MEIRVHHSAAVKQGDLLPHSPPNGTLDGQGLPAHPRKPLRRRARVVGLWRRWAYWRRSSPTRRVHASSFTDVIFQLSFQSRAFRSPRIHAAVASMPHATWWTWAAMDVPLTGATCLP